MNKKAWNAKPRTVERDHGRVIMDNIALWKHIPEMEGLTMAEGAVARAIADHRNAEHGQCNPSYQRIAFCANCSKATVKRSIRSLVKKGVFTCRNEHRVSSQYDFEFDRHLAEDLGWFDDDSF